MFENGSHQKGKGDMRRGENIELPGPNYKIVKTIEPPRLFLLNIFFVLAGTIFPIVNVDLSGSIKCIFIYESNYFTSRAHIFFSVVKITVPTWSIIF